MLDFNGNKLEIGDLVVYREIYHSNSNPITSQVIGFKHGLVILDNGRMYPSELVKINFCEPI